MHCMVLISIENIDDYYAYSIRNEWDRRRAEMTIILEEYKLCKQVTDTYVPKFKTFDRFC